MELEFSEHARERMEQYGVGEEQVLSAVQEPDEIRVGVGDAQSTNYIKHGIVRGRLSLRVAVDPYRQPQRVSTVHPFVLGEPVAGRDAEKRGEAMRIKIDWEADVLHVVFDEETRPEVAEEVGNGLVLDLDENDRVVGFEVSGLSKKCGETKALSSLEIREPTGRKVG